MDYERPASPCRADETPTPSEIVFPLPDKPGLPDRLDYSADPQPELRVAPINGGNPNENQCKETWRSNSSDDNARCGLIKSAKV